MTIELNFNIEQLSAIEENAASVGHQDMKPEDWLAEVITYQVKGWTEQAYNQSVNALGSAARSLPYEARKQLIAQVQSMI